MGVPGNIALMAQPHRKWGKLPWATIFKPAIRLADKGFVVNKTLESRLKARFSPFGGNSTRRAAIYWVTESRLLLVDTAQPENASDFEAAGKERPRRILHRPHRGADCRVRSPRQAVNPGDMTCPTLRNIAPRNRRRCARRTAFMWFAAWPRLRQGRRRSLQILGTLQRFDLKAIGQNSPKSWFLIGQAMQLAYADREKYLGDSDLSMCLSLALLNPNISKSVPRLLINPEKARTDYPAGKPPGAAPRTAAISSEVAGTTHFTAVDAQGQCRQHDVDDRRAIFGSQLVAGGFFLNNELTDFTFSPRKGRRARCQPRDGRKATICRRWRRRLCFDREGRAVLTLGFSWRKAHHHARDQDVDRRHRLRPCRSIRRLRFPISISAAASLAGRAKYPLAAMVTGTCQIWTDGKSILLIWVQRLTARNGRPMAGRAPPIRAARGHRPLSTAKGKVKVNRTAERMMHLYRECGTLTPIARSRLLTLASHFDRVRTTDRQGHVEERIEWPPSFLTILTIFPNLVTMFLARAGIAVTRRFCGQNHAGVAIPSAGLRCRAAGCGLCQVAAPAGLEKGDRVMLVSENRPEWCIADLGIMAAGCVTVPTYVTNTERDHQHIHATTAPPAR